MFCPYLVIVIDTVISIDTNVSLATQSHQNQTIIDWGLDSGEMLPHPDQKREFENSLFWYFYPESLIPLSYKVSTIIVLQIVVFSNHKKPFTIGTLVTVHTSPVALWFAGLVVTLNKVPLSSRRIFRIGSLIGGCLI